MSEWKDESDTWCRKHQCAKVWMMQNSFCPECEKDAHGDRGVVKKYDPTTNIVDDDKDEVTTPNFDPSDWNKTRFSARAAWEAHYGVVTKVVPQDFGNYHHVYTTKNVYAIGDKALHAERLMAADLLPWHPLLAKLFPVP